MNHTIALIATGDELANGEVLNTNGATIAQRLFAEGINIGDHVIVSDKQMAIVNAIRYQLTHYDYLILIGGLGPTSDDRTRFALAEYLQTELIFNDVVWQHICQRFKERNLPIHDSSRQQALFPHQAVILPNDHGSAAGCLVQHHEQHIFMLPGPPKECLPMFDAHVLPRVQHLRQPVYRLKWFLQGAREGEIAAQIEATIPHLNCKFGYRWAPPHLEFKLSAPDADTLEQAKKELMPLLEKYLVSDAP